jgi:hypothetical protein
MSHVRKYSAVSSASSRFATSDRVVNTSNMAGGGIERVTIVGVITDVVNDKFDYSFSVVPIDMSKFTSPACVSDNGIMFNLGLSKVAPPDDVKQAIEKKRKAADMGKSIPKDRLVSDNWNERKFLMTTNDMRIQLEKATVENSIDSNATSDDKKDKDKTKTLTIQDKVLQTYRPGTIVKLVDTDPTYYKKVSETSPDEFTVVVKLKARSIELFDHPGVAEGMSIETIIGRSKVFNAALTNQLLISRKLLEEHALHDSVYKPWIQPWINIARAFTSMRPRLHVRQTNVEEVDNFFTEIGIRIHEHIRDHGLANLYTAIQPFMSAPMTGTIVHNPNVHSDENVLLDQLQHFEFTTDELKNTLPEVLATYVMNSVEVNTDYEIVIVKMVPRLIHLCQEHQFLTDALSAEAGATTNTTMTGFTNNDKDWSSDVCGKMRLSMLGAIFGNLSRGLAIGVANSLGRFPFVATMRNMHADTSAPISEFFNNVRFDVLRILKERGLRVSDAWIKANACDEDGAFIQPDDDSPFSSKYEPRANAPALYTNFVTDRFVALGGAHDTCKKIEKDVKKITSLAGNENCKIYYTVLPLVPYDPCTYPVSTKKVKVTSAEREAYLQDMIDAVAEGDTPVAKANNFFSSGKGILYAFVA